MRLFQKQQTGVAAAPDNGAYYTPARPNRLRIAALVIVIAGVIIGAGLGLGRYLSHRNLGNDAQKAAESKLRITQNPQSGAQQNTAQPSNAAAGQTSTTGTTAPH